MSDIYRVEFIGRRRTLSDLVSIKTVIKTFPKNEATRKTFRSAGFFRNEIIFYLEILPVLLEFQSSKNLIEPFECMPKVFGTITDGENDFLALEDLSVYDFVSATRQEGIDYVHCKYALECFARFHALSFAYRDQNPENFEILQKKISEMYYHEKHWDWYQNFWKLCCICCIDAVEKEYPGTIYSEKIKKFATRETLDRMATAAKNKDHAVFSHGDSWTPNFLFKYKPGSNEPVDAKMIDFQLTRCASPILDISFFIYACSTEDLRKDYYHVMLKHYHDNLCSQIRNLGSNPDKVYSWDCFMEEVKKYAFFGLAFSFESTPVIILDPEDAFNMNLEVSNSNLQIQFNIHFCNSFSFLLIIISGDRSSRYIYNLEDKTYKIKGR